MNLDLRTSIGPQTFTFRSLEKLLEPYRGKRLLTPREANVLTFHIIENLMVENCDRETLKILARYLSRQSFDDLVEERVTNHYCGYPLCKYSDPSQIKEMQMNKVVVKLRMPRYYNSKYCCKRHYQAAEFYKRQLSSEALFMRTNMDEPFFRSDTYENAIVLLEEYFEAKRGNNVNLNTPAMNELMVLMEKMQIEDDEVDGEVVEDNKLADITVVEKQGPQQSNSSYGEGGAGGGVGGGL